MRSTNKAMKTAQEILDLYYLPPDMYGNFKIMQAMEDYADQFKPKWINVLDELPDYGSRWIVFCRGAKETTKAEFRNGMWFLSPDYKTELRFVTHYRPLPEIPI